MLDPVTFSIHRTICRLFGKSKSFDAEGEFYMSQENPRCQHRHCPVCDSKDIHICLFRGWKMEISVAVSRGVLSYLITVHTPSFCNSTCMVFS
jgi:hypothetical protein